jgi:hypothetical protein
MRKLLFSLLAVVLLGSLSSCEDKDQYTSVPAYLNLSLGGTSTEDAGTAPDGGTLEVTVQPSHASFFQMQYVDSLGTNIVTYTAEAGYEGFDYFQVVSSEGTSETSKKTVLHYYVNVTP